MSSDMQIVATINLASANARYVVPNGLTGITYVVGAGSVFAISLANQIQYTASFPNPNDNENVGVALNAATNKLFIATDGLGSGAVLFDATAKTSIVTNSFPGVMFNALACQDLPEQNPLCQQQSPLEVNASRNGFYALEEGVNRLDVVDGTTGAIKEYITVGSSPIAVKVNPTTNKIYVANYGDDTVSVITE